MSTLFVGRGDCRLGTTRMDAEGNVVEQTGAKWEPNAEGSCVAICDMDSDKMEPTGAAEVFGDWDAAHFLARVLEKLGPGRPVNFPDFRTILKRAVSCGCHPTKKTSLSGTPLPMRVFFGQESFVDGVDITREEFFDRLSSSDELPTTSQLNPDDFLEVFQKYVDQGDQIVGIFLSTELSGTCQSACIARDMVEGGEIHIVDSRTVTFGLALLVEEAARMRDERLSAQELEALARGLGGISAFIRASDPAS